MIKVNDTCIGCGACVAIAPENFNYDEGVSTVIKNEVNDQVREAIDACPVGAIEIAEEAATTEEQAA